ncbi:RNA polymerase sigma factor [Cohnella panacarvi]|uniref:RNA polymerase sigma factor n=1 Tax=Cohnella panacarvi TaxID=400776 RepID=UPI00047A089F|nr:RNA polymerase sigma factor [Cohnella panacarvi]
MRVANDYLKYVVQVSPSNMEEIVVEYWSDIWNYAFFLTKKYDAADDITQDTFIYAFRSLQGFRGQSSIKTWLLKICRNRVLNYRKSAFFRKIIPVSSIRPVPQSASAEAVYFSKLKMDEVVAHLFSLSYKYREVLLLEIRHGLSIAEISILLGVPEGTVKSRLHRARQAMRKKFGEENK